MGLPALPRLPTPESTACALGRLRSVRQRSPELDTVRGTHWSAVAVWTTMSDFSTSLVMMSAESRSPLTGVTPSSLSLAAWSSLRVKTEMVWMPSFFLFSGLSRSVRSVPPMKPVGNKSQFVTSAMTRRDD